MLKSKNNVLIISFVLISIFLIASVALAISIFNSTQFNRHLHATKNVSLHNQNVRVQIENLLLYFNQRNNDMYSIVQRVPSELEMIKNNIQKYRELLQGIEKRKYTRLYDQLSTFTTMIENVNNTMLQNVDRLSTLMKQATLYAESTESAIIRIQLYDTAKLLLSFNAIIFQVLDNNTYILAEQSTQFIIVIILFLFTVVVFYLIFVLYFVIPHIKRSETWRNKTLQAIQEGKSLELGEERNNEQELFDITQGINSLIKFKGSIDRNKDVVSNTFKEIFIVCQEQIQHYSTVLQGMYRDSSFINENYKEASGDVVRIGRISQDFNNIVYKMHTYIHSSHEDLGHCINTTEILKKSILQVYDSLNNASNVHNTIQKFVNENHGYIKKVGASADRIKDSCFNIEQSNKNIQHISERIMILTVNKTIEHSIQENTTKEELQNISRQLSKYVAEIEKSNKLVENISIDILNDFQRSQMMQTDINSHLVTISEYNTHQQRYREEIAKNYDLLKSFLIVISERLVAVKDGATSARENTMDIQRLSRALMEYLRHIPEVGATLKEESTSTIYAIDNVKRQLVSIMNKAINQNELEV